MYHLIGPDDDGNYWFWDKAGLYKYGPYKDEAIAGQALLNYVNSLNGGTPGPIKPEEFMHRYGGAKFA